MAVLTKKSKIFIKAKLMASKSCLLGLVYFMICCISRNAILLSLDLLKFQLLEFQIFSISDLSYGTNQDFMPFIQVQFFVAQSPQKLHSGISNPVLLQIQNCTTNCLVVTQAQNTKTSEHSRDAIITNLHYKELMNEILSQYIILLLM